MDLSKISLEDIENGMLKRSFPSASIGLQSDMARHKYESNLQLLSSDLQRIVSRIELHPIHREHDSEDRTSVEIVNGLRLLNHTAEHEASYGGNCDICVNEDDKFIWLGEAKIDYNNTHIMEGFRQLSDRYANGDIRDGGLLIYCKNDTPQNVLASWRKYLENKENRSNEYGLTFTEDAGHNYFVTEHLNRSTGTIFTVKHMVISLFDAATDKSARKKKKCSHSCEQCCPTVSPANDASA